MFQFVSVFSNRNKYIVLGSNLQKQWGKWKWQNVTLLIAVIYVSAPSDNRKYIILAIVAKCENKYIVI